METKSLKGNLKNDKLNNSHDFGGWIGCLGFFLIISGSTLYGHQHYYLKKYNLGWDSINILDYFTFESLFLYSVFILFQIILFLLPIGPLLNNQKTSVPYKFHKNGGLSTIISLSVMYLIHCYYKSTTWIVDQSVQIIISGFLICIILSFILYICSYIVPSSKINEAGNSGNFFNDFIFGREIAPKIGPIDVKILFFRVFANGVNVVNLLLILNSETMKSQFWWDPAFLSSIFLFTYLIDFLWYEDFFVTAFEYSQEGFGFMSCIVYILYPYFIPLITASLVSSGFSYSRLHLFASIIAFATSFIITRLITNQKSIFRQNPEHPSVKNIHYVKTANGKNLLADGWWGISRHPNYLCDMLMHFSLYSLLGTSDFVPYWYLILTLILLVNRIYRVENRCSNVYGEDWKRYCSIVKYRLIPYIY